MIEDIDPSKVMIVIDTAKLGGPGKGLLQLLNHRESNRFRYIVCTFGYRKPKSTEFIDTMRDAGHDLRLLPERFRFDLGTIVEALKIARGEQISLVQSHGYKAHLVAAVVANRLRIPWLAMTHGWTWENWKISLYNRVERLLLRGADVAAAVSPPLLRELVQLRGSDRPSQLILNAVDSDEIHGERGGVAIRKQYGVSEGHLLMGVFGRLSPEKGAFIALKAFEQLCKHLDHIRLLFVGDGIQSDDVKLWIASHGLEDRIKMAGYQNKMRDFYEAIDLLVIPSLTEGLPNVLLEAMSLGVPAVGTNVGAIPDVIQHGENGWLVAPGDVQALAGQLLSAVADPIKLRQHGDAARQSLHPRFSPCIRVKTFLSLYDKLINEAECAGITPLPQVEVPVLPKSCQT